MAENKKSFYSLLRLVLALFFLFSTFIILPEAMERRVNPSYNKSGNQDKNLHSFAQDEILVRFKPSVSAFGKKGLVSARGHNIKKSLSHTDLNVVKINTGESVEDAVEQYRKMDSVELVQPNFRYYIATTTPMETNFTTGQLWGLKNTGATISNATYTTHNPGTAGMDMDLETAWDYGTDCSSIIVAVIDTGVNYNHEDMAANMWGTTTHGYDFVDGDYYPMDLNGHGTHVAGTIGAAGNNDAGTTCGVCWKVQIMAIRVLDETGSGYTDDITEGIYFAVNNGAKIINMSLGGGGYDTLFSDAITYAQENDVLVVVAAGNDTVNNEYYSTYPCNFTQDNIVCVAALDQGYDLADFSNWGNVSVDVGAPGTNILSTWPGTETVITEDFSSGWSENLSDTNAWETDNIDIYGDYYDILFNPPGWDSAYYGNSIDEQVYKNFGSFLTENSIILNFYANIDVATNDSFKIRYINSNSNPFPSGTLLDSLYGTTNGDAYLYSYSLSNCVSSSNCSVGFQLKTNSSGVAHGVGILLFDITTLTLDNTHYNVINGTSMATPHVAGLAALIWAFNPGYTYDEVAASIINGGDVTSSLQGKTVSGKAVDAWGSIQHVNPPRDVTVSKI